MAGSAHRLRISTNLQGLDRELGRIRFELGCTQPTAGATGHHPAHQVSNYPTESGLHAQVAAPGRASEDRLYTPRTHGPLGYLCFAQRFGSTMRAVEWAV